MRILTKKIRCCLFLLLFFNQLTAQHFVSPHINVNSTVLLQNDSGYSSGFVVVDSLYLYLVTSRHSFIGVRQTPYYADFFLTNNWCKVLTYNEYQQYGEQYSFAIVDLLDIYRKGDLKFDSVHDVVVIRFGKFNKERNLFSYTIPGINTSKNNSLPSGIELNKFANVNNGDLGQQICTVGYPRSLGLEDVPQYDFTRPLLRKGIIAAVDTVKGNIIIDCPSYKGNSGGPVFELIKYGGKMGEGVTYNLLGLVSEFIPYKEDKYDSNLNVKGTFIWNSGYSIVTPSKYILNLISAFGDDSSKKKS
jgi:hypothetical protein